MTSNEGQVAGGFVSEWAKLGGFVDSGQLSLDEDVALRCAQHCEKFAAKLRILKDDAKRLPTSGAFGTLPSGIALEEKFNRTADGGEYSMVDALSDHIKEMEAMQALFEKIHLSYASTQDAAVASLQAIDPEV